MKYHLYTLLVILVLAVIVGVLLGICLILDKYFGKDFAIALLIPLGGLLYYAIYRDVRKEIKK